MSKFTRINTRQFTFNFVETHGRGKERRGEWGGQTESVAGACSGNDGEFYFVFFFSVYADNLANSVKSRAELEATANELQAILTEFRLAIHVRHIARSSNTVAMFVRAHG